MQRKTLTRERTWKQSETGRNGAILEKSHRQDTPEPSPGGRGKRRRQVGLSIRVYNYIHARVCAFESDIHTQCIVSTNKYLRL